MPEVVRIGHKGAGLIEEGNSRAAFEAALAHGVDMIEFDVLPHDGRLVLAHDPEDAATRACLTLDEGLALFASEAYAGVRLDVDLKWHGYEDEVARKLEQHGLTARTLVSTMETRSLRRLRDVAPDLKLGRSVPKLRKNPMERTITKPLGAAVYAWSQTGMLRGLVAELRAGQIDAVMAHYALVTKRFAAQVLGAGGELYVWTVDDAKKIEAMTRLQVTGVITNDPRLFSRAPRTSPR